MGAKGQYLAITLDMHRMTTAVQQITCPSAGRKTALKEEFGGDVEAATEALDVVLVEVALTA